MNENILCSSQYIFYYLQSGWMFINRPLVWDLPMKSSGVFQEDR